MKQLKWYHLLAAVAFFAQAAMAAVTVILEGNDLVEANGIDTRRPNVGEHVITGNMPGRYPFLSTSDTLLAYSEGGSADNGWAWVECLDNNGKVGIDSVQIVNGNGGGFTGPCGRVLAVRRAEFRGTAANTGVVRYHAGTAAADSTSILAQIEEYQVKWEGAVWTVARHHNDSRRPIQGLRIQSLTVTAAPSSSFADGTSAYGAWAIAYKDSGSNWRNFDAGVVRVDGLPRVYTYDAEPLVIGRLAEIAVPFGVTSSAAIPSPVNVQVRLRAVEQ